MGFGASWRPGCTGGAASNGNVLFPPVKGALMGDDCAPIGPGVMVIGLSRRIASKARRQELNERPVNKSASTTEPSIASPTRKYAIVNAEKGRQGANRPKGRGISSSLGDIFMLLITLSRTCVGGALALIISASNAFCRSGSVSFESQHRGLKSFAPSHAKSMEARAGRP